MKRLMKIADKILPRDALDIQVTDNDIKVYLKDESEKLHSGEWDSKITNMIGVEDNHLGYITWRVNEDKNSPSIMVSMLEVRPEYENTNLAMIILNTFKEKVVKPLIDIYGKGNVKLDTGFVNQKLWDVLDRVIGKIGLVWDPQSEKYRDNTGQVKLRELLLENGANLLGGVVASNFPIDKYLELYREAYNTNDYFFYGYVLSVMSPNGDIVYTPNENDSLEPVQFHLFLDIGNLEIEIDIQEFLSLYKQNPNVIENIKKTIGENGQVMIGELNTTASQLKEELDKLLSE